MSSYELHFRDGPYVCNHSDDVVTVKFYLGDRLDFEIDLAPGHWGRTFKRYLAPWRIELVNANGEVIRHHRFDLRDRSIGVFLDSRSLGDTLAWVPQVERLAAMHPTTRIYLSHYWSDLGIVSDCPNVEFVDPDAELPELYATFKIGYFLGEEMLDRHRSDPRRMPLAKIPSDILDLPFDERRPKLDVASRVRPRSGRYACFAMESTAGFKLWHYPGGWQQVVDYLTGAGFEAVLLQKEPGDLANVVNLSGDRPIQERMTELIDCDLFIGPASGLAWLAWALGRPVVMIGGFSEPFTEFQQDCYRVFNRDFCTGCWNDPRFDFDRSDWDWCPVHRGSARQFECSKQITPEMVIEAVNNALGLVRRGTG
jgi:autotransporter strand-loop-strand O-heptosyltransferase